MVTGQCHYNPHDITEKLLKVALNIIKQTKNRTHYPDPEPASLCSFSLLLCAYRRSNKYYYYSRWN
jgi:hypothetical protein